MKNTDVSENFYDAAAKLFLFEGMTADDTDRLLKDASLTAARFDAGEYIFEPDRSEPSLGVLVGGCAEVTTPSCGGRVTLRILKKGDIFGAASLFGGDGSQISAIRARTRSSAVFISRAAVQAIITESPRAAVSYIAFLSDRVRFLNHRISCFTAGSADASLARYLISLPCENGVVELPACKPLAELLGMGRASLYRALDSLQSSGAIERRGRNVSLLSRERLAEIAGNNPRGG